MEIVKEVKMHIRKGEKRKNPVIEFYKDYIYYPQYRLWNNHISMWHREIYWFWQRGKKGYSDRDTWSFDHYLIKVMEGGLRQLAENKHGCPSEFFHCPHEKVECETKCDTCMADNKGECIACEDWKTTLIAMADGFKDYNDKVMEDGILMELTKDQEMYFEPTEKGDGSEYVKFEPEISKEEWDKYREQLKEEEKKFKIHFRMFQKYFRNLWD
jgi:hypothetical protein